MATEHHPGDGGGRRGRRPADGALDLVGRGLRVDRTAASTRSSVAASTPAGTLTVAPGGGLPGAGYVTLPGGKRRAHIVVQDGIRRLFIKSLD